MNAERASFWRRWAALLGALALVSSALAENRSFDGSGNNLSKPAQGATGAMFRRVAAAAYDDGLSAPATLGMTNARVISNVVCAADATAGVNAYGLSDFVWQWGQFLDHDITLAATAEDLEEAFFIEVAAGDPLEGFIPLMRTIFDPATGESSPREQINSVTSYIDASNVYGSDAVRAGALRTFSGGQLKMSSDGLLPMNTSGLPNANDTGLPEHDLFLGGDVRSNEQLGLTCMHTVFVREHNRLAAQIAVANPGWNDDQIYHRARKIVGAQVQAITYNEFLPALLGPGYAPDPQTFAYDPGRDATATNEFATALYRIGHTMVSDQLLLMGDDGQPAGSGTLTVLEAFFSPSTLIDEPEKVDWILMGLAMQEQMNADPQIVDNLRNQLFGPAGAGGLDLAALNIQRGRDHGLASYNNTRVAYGLPRKISFAEVTSDPQAQAALASVYNSPDEIELWIGGLVESHMPGSPVGELIAESMRQQFIDMAEGDRFFYHFDAELAALVDEIDATRLCDIIMRNTDLTNLQNDVFRMPTTITGDGARLSVALVGQNIEILLEGADPAASYALQYSTDGALWEPLGEAIETDGAGMLSAIDEGAVGRAGRMLYRFARTTP